MTPTDNERQRRIEAVFDSHFGAVAAYFIRRSETRQDADDATAQVFAVAWTKLERLPAETSGATNDADGSMLNAFTQTTRFSGKDVDLSGTGTVRVESSGQLASSPIAGLRVAGGTLYVKDHDHPWRAATGSSQMSLADMTADAEKLPSRLASPATRDAAQALATAMTEVTVSADGHGYDGQITTSALQSAYGSVDPLTVEEVTAHPANDLGPIAVHVDVDDAGVLSKVTFTVRSTWTHPTLPAVTMVRSIDYSGLGEPEQIDAPQVPAS